ncbi:MAG: lysophospholipid acyltransferase family protein [candidate division WOR-3 bacterium]
MRLLRFRSRMRKMDRMRITVWTRIKQLLLFLYGLCIRVKLVGNTRLVVPLQRSFIVAANHLNGADSVVLQVALRTRLFFATSRKWFLGRFSRFVLWHICDGIPVEPGDALGSVSGLRHCISTLQAGGSIGIYPEGEFNKGGRLTHLYDGTAYLAARTGTPILPVYIRNLRLRTRIIDTNRSIESWTGFLSVAENLFNTNLEIVVGEPIVPSGAPVNNPAQLRDEISRINAELQKSFDRLAAFRN